MSGTSWRDRILHPFWGSLILLAACYLFLRYGLVHLPPLVGLESAPVPSSVMLQYMATVVVGVVLYASAEERRWRRFREPLLRLLGDESMRWQRAVALPAAALLAGWLTYERARPSYGAPPALRSVHPAPPTRIEVRGETLRLAGLENPLRHRGSMEEHLETGARVYIRNCMPCHGDRLDGQGHFTPALDPPPADFTSSGTIAQLTESYVFWRIAKGGPGLPAEGTPWNSAMPAWEEILEVDEIWAVILYLYDVTGWTPRTWEEAGEPEARASEGAG